MKFQEINPISRIEAEKIFHSGATEKICDALIRLVLNDPDRDFLETQCVRLSDFNDLQIRGLVITCIGHIARIHGRITGERLYPVLEKLKKDDRLAGRVEDAIDDIEIYTKTV